MTLGNDISIMEIDHSQRELVVAVRVKCTAEEYHTNETGQKAATLLGIGVRYLFHEGFLTSVKGWNIFTRVIGHNN